MTTQQQGIQHVFVITAKYDEIRAKSMYPIDDFAGMADVINGVFNTNDVGHVLGQTRNNLNANILTGQFGKIIEKYGVFNASATRL